MKKLYVGCALKYAPEQFIKNVFELRDGLRNHYQMLDFITPGTGTVQEVYESDVKCVREADMLLAICDYPSLGLGYEIGLAVECGKKILAVAQESSEISRFILGITYNNFKFVRYQTFEDLKQLMIRHSSRS